MERIAESGKSGCFVVGKCGLVEFFAHFSAICAKKQLPQKRSPPEGACQPLCSAKRPPRPLVGDRCGFLHARLHEKPAKTPRFALWQIGEELIGAPSQANPIPRGAPPRPRKGGASWGGGYRRRLPHTAKPYAARRGGSCLWERRRLEKWERAGQVESRERGENCRKRQKWLFCSGKVRFGGVFCSLLSYLREKTASPKAVPS